MSTLKRMAYMLIAQVSVMYGIALTFTDSIWVGIWAFVISIAFAYLFVRSFTYSDNS